MLLILKWLGSKISKTWINLRSSNRHSSVKWKYKFCRIFRCKLNMFHWDGASHRFREEVNVTNYTRGDLSITLEKKNVSNYIKKAFNNFFSLNKLNNFFLFFVFGEMEISFSIKLLKKHIILIVCPNTAIIHAHVTTIPVLFVLHNQSRPVLLCRNPHNSKIWSCCVDLWSENIDHFWIGHLQTILSFPPKLPQRLHLQLG